MVNCSPVTDPLNVEELRRQAEIAVKAWRLPQCHNESSRPGVKDWQELMSDRLIKPRRFTKRGD